MAANLLSQVLRARVSTSNYIKAFTSHSKAQPGLTRVKLWGLTGVNINQLRVKLRRDLSELQFTDVRFETISSRWNGLTSLAVYAVPPASIPVQVPKKSKPATAAKKLSKPVAVTCPHCGSQLNWTVTS